MVSDHPLVRTIAIRGEPWSDHSDTLMNRCEPGLFVSHPRGFELFKHPWASGMIFETLWYRNESVLPTG